MIRLATGHRLNTACSKPTRLRNSTRLGEFCATIQSAGTYASSSHHVRIGSFASISLCRSMSDIRPISDVAMRVAFQPFHNRQAFCRHDRYWLAQDSACEELQPLASRWWIADTDNIREMFAITTIDYSDPSNDLLREVARAHPGFERPRHPHPRCGPSVRAVRARHPSMGSASPARVRLYGFGASEADFGIQLGKHIP
jgi:hypothetical protein